MSSGTFALLMETSRHANIYLKHIGEYPGQGESCFVTTRIEEARVFDCREEALEFKPRAAELSTVKAEDIQVVRILS